MKSKTSPIRADAQFQEALHSLVKKRRRDASGAALWAPMTITFQQISYSVPTGFSLKSCLRNERKWKQVLHPFTGCIQPGELVAVMGESRVPVNAQILMFRA